MRRGFHPTPLFSYKKYKKRPLQQMPERFCNSLFLRNDFHLQDKSSTANNGVETFLSSGNFNQLNKCPLESYAGSFSTFISENSSHFGEFTNPGVFFIQVIGTS